jgi:NAD(P)H dehydrogenase (quinone)
MARIEADLSVRLQGVMTEPRIDYRPMAEEHYDHTIRLHDSVAPGEDGLNAHREG